MAAASDISTESELSRSGDAELEWERVVAALAQYAVGPLRERPFFPLHGTRVAAAAALDRTREALLLDQLGDGLPLTGWPDVLRHIARLDREGDLDGTSLRELVDVLAAARVLRLFLGRNRGRVKALRARLDLPTELDALEDTLSSSLEPDGRVSVHASPELARLRTEVANLRARLVRRLEGMLESRRDILQEPYYTEREGRYVLPVRADAHEKLHGIVHATSASGATLFIEPRELVAQGNRLKMARAEMEREEARILSLLSASSRAHTPALASVVDALDEADRCHAAVCLTEALDGRVPELDTEDVLDLQAARHPLLVLDGADVVANDLRVAAGSALLLSGPNAGGKTVALKTLGLSALMARAGLPIAAAEGSRVGFFPLVRTDLGDHQSTQQNLSTFSAHISHVARILKQARPGALVLLDELAGGTDPEEGAALATAIVLELCERGAATVTTTHYPALMALGVRDARVTNAAVAFDLEQMRPTFRVNMGLAGTSCALPVARRFGIEEVVLERARAALPDARDAADTIAHELGRLRAEARADRERAAALMAEAEGRRAEADRRDEESRRACEREQERAATSLRELVRDAHHEVKAARTRLREARDEQAVLTAQRALQQVEERLPDPPARAPSAAERSVLDAPCLEKIEPGLTVWVPELRRNAVVVELGKKGRVRVVAGSLKCWVEGATLRQASGGESAVPKPPRAPQATRAQDISPRGNSNSLDLRGLRVDDALSLVETFLDRLYGEGVDSAYLLHGHGSGALRKALREHLARGLPSVRSYRAGDPREGGDALTVVALS